MNPILGSSPSMNPILQQTQNPENQLTGGVPWGNVLSGIGMSLMSSPRNAPLANAGQYIQQAQTQSMKQQEAAQKKAALKSALTQFGLAPEQAEAMAQDETAANLYLRKLEQDRAQKNSDRSYALQVEQMKQGKVTDAALYARDMGHAPGTPQYNEAIRTFYTSKFRPANNAPSGYTYGPDGKLAPIPGGPQDPDRDINEPLPGELAARFGLANQYFKRFDGIEKDLRSKDPKSVGIIDRLGFGESGALQRDMKLGSEAMMRMLTGAGMTQEEAANEVKQYLPGVGDNAATVLDKQMRLRASLRDMQREALQGRRSKKQVETEYPAFEVKPFETDPSAQPATGQPKQSAPKQIQKGQTATNPKTGETVIFDGQQWVPFT